MHMLLRLGRLAILLVLVSSIGLAALDFNSGTFGPQPIATTNHEFTPTGGTPPYTFSYAPSATTIPGFRVVNRPEIRANAAAGVMGALVGLPLAAGSYPTTIRLTDSTAAFVDKAVTVVVTGVNIAGRLPATNQLYNYGVGDTVSIQFWGIGGTGVYTYSLLSGSLPPNLNLNAATGEVYGTIGSPAGTYTFQLQAQSGAESFSRQYSMLVSPLRLTSFQNRILPNATQNLSYSQSLTMDGGTPPYKFTLEPGTSLPGGLSLSQAGVISGTPGGTPFNFNARINVADSAATPNQVKLYFNISVLPQTPQPLWITNAVINDSMVGGNNNIQINATGGLPPYTFTLEPGSTLPAGVVVRNGTAVGPDLSPGLGYLSGTVQSPGVYSLTLRVTDSVGNTATRPYNWRVSSIGFLQGSVPPSTGANPPAPTPVLGTPYSQYLIPIGGTQSYTVTPINIPAGMSVDNAGLLSGTPGESGNNRPLTLGLADSGGAQLTSYGSMNINSTTATGLNLNGGDLGVAVLGGYSFTVTAGGGGPPYSVTLVGGSLPPGLELLTGKDFENNNNNSNAAIFGGALGAPGPYKFTLRVTDGAGNVGQREYRLRVTNLNIMNNGLPNGTVGVYYSQTLEARGGTPPYTFSLTNGALPTGLTLDPLTGVISGTPATTSALSIGIGLADSRDYVTRSFTLNIYSLRITNPNVIPVVATNGVPFSYTFVVDPAVAVTWSVSSTVQFDQSNPLPHGLTLDPNTGVLSGTPVDDPEHYDFVITASTATASVSKDFTLFGRMPELAGLFLDLPMDSLGDYLVGSRVYIGLTVAGGTPPYTVTALSALPPGLALVPYTQYTPNGNIGHTVLAGIPTTPANYSFRLRYADSAGAFVDRTVRLNVTTLRVAVTQLGSALYNTPYSAQFKGVGGSGPYTFALVDRPGNVLPAGLSLAPDGTVSGTPTATGYYGFVLTLSSGGVSRENSASMQVWATGTRRIDLGFRNLPDGADVSLGRQASARIEAYGGGSGAMTWTIASGSLPPGMRLLSGASLPPNSTSPPNAILAGAPSAPGTYRFALRLDDSTGNFGVVDKTLVVSPLRVGPINYKPALATFYPIARAGVPYSFTITSLTGRAPFKFAALPGTYLPAGMSLSSTGVLSGRPDDAGDFALPLLITDADGKTLRIDNVDEAGLYVLAAGAQMGPLNADEMDSAPVPTVDAPFTFWPLNDLLYPGAGTPPFTWSIIGGALPPGLSIESGGGATSDTISGTPKAAGVFNFDIMVTDANGKSSVGYGANFNVGVLGISPRFGHLPATAGAPYSQQFTISGCSGSCTIRPAYFSDMPPGLSMSSSGLLSGTPTTYGPFLLIVEVLETASGHFIREPYILDIAPPGAPSPALQVTPSSISLNYVAGNPAPSPIPLSIDSTGAAISYNVFSSNSWLSVSAAGGATPGTVNAIITPGGAGTFNGAITVTSAGASNAPVTIPVSLTVSAAVPCSYSLGSSAGSILAAGGAGSFTVNTTPTCDWTAATTDGWITVGSPGSGTGDGTVNFTAAPNGTGATRIGSITVQGLVYTVTQFGGPSCSFTISPTSATVAAGSSTGGVVVSASAGSCGWSTVQVDPWISASGSGSGTGSGAMDIAVAANPDATSRTGTITVAGQTFTVNQAGKNCTFSLTSAVASLPYTLSSASVNVLAPAGCAWTTDPGAGWISLDSGGSGSGNSVVPVSLSVQANSSTAPRSAGALIAGRTFLITQDGVPCSFSLSAVNPMQPSAGGGGSVAITAAGSGCGWIASSNADWLHLSATSGTGNGSVNFTVDTNADTAARSATLTVAGQNIIVNQGGTTCSFSLRSPSASMPAAAGASSVGLTTAAGCAWTAVSNAPAWLHITSGTGPGPKDVAFSVDANPGPTDRSGTLTIAGLSFGVTQPAPACIITVGPPSIYGAIETGGGTTFSYTTSVAGCPHSVESYASWINVDSAAYGGTNGSVTISVDQNTYAAARSGVVKIGDQNFTVNQAASTCAYTLTSFGATFYRPGGAGSVPVNFTPSFCVAPPVLVNAPAGMITLGSMTSVPGTYTQNYTVSNYPSFINYTRTAQLIFSGQIYTVKQNSWLQ